MITNLKLFYNNNKNALKITRFFLISIVLLAIVWILDIKNPLLKNSIPNFFLLSAEISTNFLSNLSGVFLTVATFSFTTILTVIGNHASGLSPRIVQNFIDKKNIISLIGIFTGGFFYSILSLFLLQNHLDEERLIAGTLGVIYALASMIYFLRFVYQILKYVKGSNMIQDSYDKAAALVEIEAKKRKESERFDEDQIKTKIPIYSTQTGYIFGINFDQIFKLLKEDKTELVMTKKYSEYVAKGEHIADLNLLAKKDSEKYNSENVQLIEESFIINNNSNDRIDYQHEIINLKEIALNNLSPASFHSDTALNAISKLSILLGKLFSSKNKFIVADKNENTSIIYTSFSVKEELYLAFGQVIHYANGDPTVARHILESIYKIYLISDKSALDDIEKFFVDAYNIIIKNVKGEMHQDYVQDIYDHFIEHRKEQSDRTQAREEEW